MLPALQTPTRLHREDWKCHDTQPKPTSATMTKVDTGVHGTHQSQPGTLASPWWKPQCPAPALRTRTAWWTATARTRLTALWSGRLRSAPPPQSEAPTYLHAALFSAQATRTETGEILASSAKPKPHLISHSESSLYNCCMPLSVR